MIDLSNYLVVVVVGICMCLGYIIKHSIRIIPNDYIPLIMGALGIILNCWVNKFSFSADILLGGLVSGLASTGTYEGITRVISSLKTRKTDSCDNIN